MSTDIRIMLVDDEPNLLNALVRQLRGTLPVETYSRPKDALAKITTPRPCAVVVSDMRMPEMNGIEFLTAVQQASPDTVRIMLTGNADRETVTQAVNQSNIFRFLMKPCVPQDLQKAILDGIAQFKLVTAEKDLLQRTLAGSVKLLTDILGLARPAEFKHVLEKRELVRALCSELGISGAWELELALMLTPIGAITLPTEILEQREFPDRLTKSQREAIAAIPSVSKKLVMNIPRLERVGNLIETAGSKRTQEITGSVGRGDSALQILHVVSALSSVELTKDQIGQELGEYRAAGVEPRILQVLERLLHARCRIADKTAETEVYEIKCADLCAGQILLSDVLTSNGKLLIASGNMLTDTLVERIRGYASLVGVVEPIKVHARIPTIETET
ncbi:MAG: response regulator [Oligoflexia bacterium]|nr:response regulator [Oligoflexia bacterium]